MPNRAVFPLFPLFSLPRRSRPSLRIGRVWRVFAAALLAAASLCPAPSQAQSEPADNDAPTRLTGPISSNPDLRFDCSVISDSLNQALHAPVASCRAEGGRVLIRGNPAQVDDYGNFFSIVFLAAGLAVSEGFYNPHAEFVVGRDPRAPGCLSLNGAQAANFQRQFDHATLGDNFDVERASRVADRMLAEARPVECPPFLGGSNDFSR